MNNNHNHQSGKPQFTVVMPAYNHQNYVEEAVRSVMGQTFTDWELWAVDDGSTDETGKILDRLACEDSRIHVIHKTNGGVSSARNTAIANARSEWLAYLDSDDVWLPDTLQKYHDFINSNPQADFIYGYRHRMDSAGNKTILDGRFQDAPTSALELFTSQYLSPCRVCHRTELIEKAGNYDENLPACEDYELFLRFSLFTKFYPLGQPTAWRRRHDTNISRQTGHSRMREAAILRKFADGHPQFITEDVKRRRLGRLYYSAGRQYFKSRCFAQAVQAFRCAEDFSLPLKGKILKTLAFLLTPAGRTDGKKIPTVDNPAGK
ncbi:MAG TPA: glycosyltransferase family A protein [Phycisphaerae bacterium]|nr:glycosyltransferase family A protein [Phycisphaerae bacterium]